MCHKLLLRIASGLALFTCFGHTAGTFMSIPKEQTEHVQVYETMQRPVVPMPIGPVRSYAELFFGTNLSVSVLLLLIGFSLWVLSKDRGTNHIQIVLNGVTLLAIAGISATYFFPLPAICTGIGGILTLFSLKSAGPDSSSTLNSSA